MRSKIRRNSYLQGMCDTSDRRSRVLMVVSTFTIYRSAILLRTSSYPRVNRVTSTNLCARKLTKPVFEGGKSDCCGCTSLLCTSSRYPVCSRMVGEGREGRGGEGGGRDKRGDRSHYERVETHSTRTRDANNSRRRWGWQGN